MIRILVVFLTMLFLSSFEEAAPPQKKILLATIPKAGTHLLIKAVEMITESQVQWIGLADTRYFRPQADLQKPHRITALHLFPEIARISEAYKDRYIKVLMIRDPRDVMISFTHHLRNLMTWSSCPTFDFESFEQLPFDEQLKEIFYFPASERNPNTCFEHAIAWMQDPSVLVCRFEDLVGPKGGSTQEKQKETIRNLAIHIGYEISEEKVDQISHQLFGGTWTFRKGKAGGWQEHYNDEHKMLFKQLMGQSVIDLGYEEDDNW